MASVGVLLADGFEELETVTVLDVLRRAGAEALGVTIAGPSVTGDHGLVLRADVSLATARHRRWDALVLPGGDAGARALRESALALRLVAAHATDGGLVGALCAGSVALAATGACRGRRLTTYPGYERELDELGAVACDEGVVADGPFVTARGPAFAMPFALALVGRLLGERVAREVAAGLLV